MIEMATVVEVDNKVTDDIQEIKRQTTIRQFNEEEKLEQDNKKYHNKVFLIMTSMILIQLIISQNSYTNIGLRATIIIYLGIYFLEKVCYNIIANSFCGLIIYYS